MQRILNLIKGFINRYVFSLEMRNPDVVYDNAIDKLINTRAQLLANAGAVKRRADDLEEQQKNVSKALKDVTNSLNIAAGLPEDQVDMVAAREAVKLQEQLTLQLDGLMDDFKQADADEKEVTTALQELDSQINDVKAEKNREIGRYRSAQARIEARARLDGLSTDSIDKSLVQVREQIKNTVSTAKLAQEMKDDSLESRVRKFQQVTSGQSADQKFLAMREAAKQKSANGQVLEKVLETTSTKQVAS